MTAVVSAASSVAAGSAVAVTARSVVDDAARPAACERRWHFVLQVADVLFPAVAEVFAGLFLAARTSFVVASRTSALAWSYPRSKLRDALTAEGRWDEPRAGYCFQAAYCFGQRWLGRHFADRHGRCRLHEQAPLRRR